VLNGIPERDRILDIHAASRNLIFGVDSLRGACNADVVRGRERAAAVRYHVYFLVYFFSAIPPVSDPYRFAFGVRATPSCDP